MIVALLLPLFGGCDAAPRCPEGSEARTTADETGAVLFECRDPAGRLQGPRRRTVGKAVMWHEEWRDGALDGVSRVWRDDVVVSETPWARGARHGAYVGRHPNGTVNVEGRYADDQADGVWTWRSGAGVLVYEAAWKAGEPVIDTTQVRLRTCARYEEPHVVVAGARADGDTLALAADDSCAPTEFPERFPKMAAALGAVASPVGGPLRVEALQADCAVVAPDAVEWVIRTDADGTRYPVAWRACTGQGCAPWAAPSVMYEVAPARLVLPCAPSAPEIR